MSTPFLGEIMMVPYDFAPVGWADCNGQLMSISQNSALHNLLGITFGGDGVTTFALPDLRGRAPIHVGGSYVRGQNGGAETVPLLTSQIPAHQHILATAPSGPPTNDPTNGLVVRGSELFLSGTPTTQLSAQAVSANGSSQSHQNMQPFLTIRFVIALTGTTPTP
jgi:microcystin-dependent protein